jgi:hypothetical protein
LAGGVQARIVTNGAQGRQIQLASGLIELAVLHGGETDTEIVTPSIALRTRSVGDYRISVVDDGTTVVTARSGQADIVTPQMTYTIVAGKTLTARGQATDPTVGFTAEVARDSFDEFNARRDEALVTALNDNAGVPPSIAGYDDLASYGRWANVASYGQVWIPNQSADWVPYRYGQWTWQGAGYGWIWVANEPWGWVPYHYGTWFYYTGFGWCWNPPQYAVLPIWVPAMVGFFGYGGGFGYSNFGWVPLGPYETYYPWYAWNPYPPPHYYPPPPPPRHRHPYPPIRMHPLVTAYRNARFGGASAVLATAWHAGDFTHPIAVDPHRVVSVNPVRGRLPMIPTPANRRFSPATVKEPVHLAAIFDQPRFALGPMPWQIPNPAALLPGTSGAERSWQQFNDARGTAIGAPGSGTAGAPRMTSPVMRAPAPTGHLTTPIVAAPSPVLHPTAPVVRSSAPVVHEATPSQTTHPEPAHESPRPPA